ncbi:MAG: tetratricopeptide repeat protein [Bacteroidota bacterium]
MESYVQKKTIPYPLSKRECQAIAKGFDDFDELVKIDDELAKIMDITTPNTTTQKEPFINVFPLFLTYTFRGEENPYLLGYIIQNPETPPKEVEEGLFTFVLYHYSSVYTKQYQAVSLKAAFRKWKKETLTKEEFSSIMPPRIAKRFKSAIRQQAKVNPLSPVIHHPNVWRWHFTTGTGDFPVTLYIVATDNEPSESFPNKSEDTSHANKDPYTVARKLWNKGSSDKRKMLRFLKKAVEAQDPRAYYALGTWYLYGSSVLKKDIVKAVQLLEKAAEANVREAVRNLSLHYEEGKIVQKNTQRAHELFLQAALLGDSEMVYEVARTYCYGIGTKIDRKTADVWYQHAEKLGISD